MPPKSKPNGTYPAKHGPNGSPALANSAALATNPISARASHEQGRAGSDDASVFSVADAPTSAASADRKATADLAESAAGERRLGTAAASTPARASNATALDTRNPFAEVPPGRERLPEDGEAFVDAVHAQVDLVALEVALLRCKDEKVVQRELGCLRELLYGKTACAAEDGPMQVIFDAPRPPKD